MASCSTALHIIGEDDDEFDWEAAVKEIDVACAQTAASTNYSTINSYDNKNSNSISSSILRIQEPHKLPSKKSDCFFPSSSTRQPTLERFLGIKKECGKRKAEYISNGFCGSGENNEENVGAEEGTSFIKIDPEAAKTWIYPVSEKAPLRDYQFNITRTALFSNTLVALPTGLGKTFIAAVVMYNYFRWFPEGKIVFAAPSRPLVMQQIEACHNIVGIPQEWTIDLTGQTNPARRADHWKCKRVFFVTPQVLEKDIYSGSCLVKNIVCLVIDEAHRANGNYSYCVAVRELMAIPVPLRILALTATPGSKQQTIQHIINNLQISTLEYRNESDPDVIPYVHERKTELIKVPMGKDAVEIDNLILEVIRPYVARLSPFGVLPIRDFQTLSPCDILNSRDKFRQNPPQDLPHMKYGEFEGCFGVLVTLYHIRKLLSSHGIKPACEMLEEKLQQGSFARLMSRNEGLLKAKLLMQQNVSHGAPSPKLSKMLDVLIDHFKMKDPQNSRVIIFSNFRGSVRDIMNALRNIGHLVKATEFIGQSSGKSLKGQSQKVQQAVLEKFRAGGYNVIVATSIGEEGLDIMEVDLVICFDANISPLRMIQRMGRTGRKHEGRVVVLACEGSELRGYLRKQANSKAIKKHMQNGGTTSFVFHSSPRMIPHIFKPEVQVVELSIQQFVPRGKKMYDDHPIEKPTYKIKLNDAENNLIAKYFDISRENTCRPSLIAFPHFQAFPSRVNKVMHSFRTGMLIDAMQLLQGLSFSINSETLIKAGGVSPELRSRTEAVKEYNENTKESRICENFPEEDCGREVMEVNVITKEDHCTHNSRRQNLTHSFLFGHEFVSIDDLGKVQISSLPQFPLKQVSPSKRASPSRTASLCHFKQDSVHFEASVKRCEEIAPGAQDLFTAEMRSTEVEDVVKSELRNTVAEQMNMLIADEKTSQTPTSKRKSIEDDATDSPKVVQYRTAVALVDESSNDPEDVEFSPRLTNYMESGVVPESPANYVGNPEVAGDEFTVPALVSTPRVHTELTVKFSWQNEGIVRDSRACEINVTSSSINEIRTPGPNANNIAPGCKSSFPTLEDNLTPVVKLPDTSFSEEWNLTAEKSGWVEQKCKFKRLRKHGDLCTKKPPDCKEQKIGPTLNFMSACASASHVGIQQGRVVKKRMNNAKVFIEEEAEVSSEVEVSGDEEDLQENNSYDDSFIDDRTNPTASSSQAEEDKIDMMAVYRRSLLTQSPICGKPNTSADFTPNSVVLRNESTSTPGLANLQTPKDGLESTARKSASFHLNPDRFLSETLPSKTLDFSQDHQSKLEIRKRKLSFYQAGYLPVNNLEYEFSFHCEAARKDSILQVEEAQVEKIQENRITLNGSKIPENENAFDDDQFYDAIDLDAVEEQAAKLLRYKPESSLQKQVTIPEPALPNLTVIGSPSFDLGI